MSDNNVIMESILKHVYGSGETEDQTDDLLDAYEEENEYDDPVLEMKGLRSRLGQAAGWVKKNPGKAALGAAAGLAMGAAAIGGARHGRGAASQAMTEFKGQRGLGRGMGESLKRAGGAAASSLSRGARKDINSIQRGVRSAAGRMPKFKKSFAEDGDVLLYLLDAAAYAYEPVEKSDLERDVNELGELIVLSEAILAKSEASDAAAVDLQEQVDFWRGFAYGAGIEDVPGTEELDDELVEKTWSDAARRKAREALDAKKRAGSHGQDEPAQALTSPTASLPAKAMKEGKREVTAADFSEKESNAQHGDGKFRYNREGVATHKMDDAGTITKIGAVNRMLNRSVMGRKEAQANQAKRPEALALAEGRYSGAGGGYGPTTSKMGKGELVGANVGAGLGAIAGGIPGAIGAKRVLESSVGSAKDNLKAAGSGAAMVGGSAIGSNLGAHAGAAAARGIGKVANWAKQNPKKAALAAGAAAGALGAGAAALRYGGAYAQGRNVTRNVNNTLSSVGAHSMTDAEKRKVEHGVGVESAKFQLSQDVAAAKQLPGKLADKVALGAYDAAGAVDKVFKKKPKTKSDVSDDEILYVVEDLVNAAEETQDVIGKSDVVDSMLFVLKAELDELYPDEEEVTEQD